MGQIFELKIRFDPDTKQCQISGPIRNEELCMLGLELAKRFLKQFNQDRIKVAPAEVELPPAPAKGIPVQVPNLRELLKNG